MIVLKPFPYVVVGLDGLMENSYMIKQECIPVGCVPAARRPYSGVCFGGGWGVSAWSRGGGIPACTEADPPVNRMTDRCKNITLATTSLRPVTSNNPSQQHFQSSESNDVRLCKVRHRLSLYLMTCRSAALPQYVIKFRRSMYFDLNSDNSALK